MMSKRWHMALLCGGVLSASSLASAQPTDECGASAPAMTLGVPLAGTTAGSDVSVEITPSLCGGYDGSGGFFDVFARFTPAATGVYQFTTCGSTTDTVVSVHSACPASDANLLDCVDDDSTCEQFSASTVSVNLTGGTTYTVRCATPYYATTGPFNITVNQITPPANDTCAGAIAVAPGASLSTSNINAIGASLPAPCLINATGDGADVWYSITIGSAAVYNIDLTPSGGGSFFLTLHSSCAGGPIACNIYDFSVNHPRISRYFTPGTYYLRVAGSRGFGGRPDEGAFTVAVSAPQAQLTNDECAGGTIITPNTTTPGTTIGATGGGATTLCASFARKDVWYRFTPTVTAEYNFNLESLGNYWAAGMTLYSGCGTGEMVCTTNSFHAVLNASTTYYIRVAGDSDNTGDFNLSVDAGTLIPANNDCANAATASVGSVVGTNAGASGEDLTLDCSYNDVRDVWYRFTAPSTGYYVFDTRGSTTLTDTSLSLFSSCGSLVICNNDIVYTGDTPNTLSEVGLAMTATQQILVRVAGTAESSGSFRLNIAGPVAAPAVPPHDQYTTPRQIVGDTYVNSVDVRSATPDQASNCTFFGQPQTNNGVWYQFTAVEPGMLTVTENGGNDHSFTSFYQFEPGAFPIADFPEQCDTVFFEYDIGESHLYLAGVRGYEYPASPITVTAEFVPQLGCCQTPSGCVIQRRSTCTGTWTEGHCGPQTVYTGGTNLPISIPNPASNSTPPTYVNSTLSVADTGLISNLSLTVNLKHNSANQVVLRLITPWGAQIQILNGIDAQSSFDGTYTFTDLALRSILEVDNEFPLNSRAYLPNNPIGGVVAGHSAAGTWTLAVGDDRTGTSGTLSAWSLTINTQCDVACPADFNNDGARDVADLFAYINAWLAKTANADFNDSGNVDVADLFAYINAWLAGC